MELLIHVRRRSRSSRRNRGETHSSVPFSFSYIQCGDSLILSRFEHSLVGRGGGGHSRLVTSACGGGGLFLSIPSQKKIILFFYSVSDESTYPQTSPPPPRKVRYRGYRRLWPIESGVKGNKRNPKPFFLLFYSPTIETTYRGGEGEGQSNGRPSSCPSLHFLCRL